MPAVHHSASFRQILHVSKEIFYPIQRHRRDDRSVSRFVIARTIYLLLLFLFLLIKILFHVGLFSFYLSPWSPSSPFTSRFLSTRPFFAHAFSNADSTHIHPFVSHFHAHIELSLLLSRWRSPTAGTCKLQTNLLIRRAEISRARLRPRLSSRIVIVNFVVLE